MPRLDQSTELKSFETSEVAVISPMGAEEPELLTDLRATPGAKVTIAASRFVETYWISTTEAPLNDPLVREALGYAIDREALFKTVEGPFATIGRPTQCGIGESPTFPWCDSTAFGRFTYDPAKAKALLTQAGWDCSTSPCRRNGVPLQVRYQTVATSVRRTTIQQLAIKQIEAAGFHVVVLGCDCGTLFGQVGCPMGSVQLQECGLETRADGSVTHLLSCAAIPTKASDFEGDNRIAWCDPTADALMRKVDRELDPAVRRSLLDQLAELEANDAIGLPLFPVPQLFAWNTDELVNVTGAYLGTPYGPFFDMDQWGRAA